MPIAKAEPARREGARLIPLAGAFARIGLADRFEVISLPSGYPAPKYVNVVVRRHEGRVDLFETSSGAIEHREALESALARAAIHRIDAVCATHSHGDHAGAAAFLATYGRDDGSRADIHLHSAGHRLLTSTALEFTDEGYSLLVARAHRGVDDFVACLEPKTFERYQRGAYRDRYLPVRRSSLSFVDHHRMPPGVIALHTPGHSDDCVMYVDEAHGVAIPGDTVLATGDPHDASTHRVMIPPLTVINSRYSRAVESYLLTIGRMRRFFEATPIRIVVPPHGRLAITDPLGWTYEAERYFDDLLGAVIERALLDPSLAGGFDVASVMPRFEHPQSVPPALASHLLGLLCLLVDEGFVDAEEQAGTRRIRFVPREIPDRDLVRRLVRTETGPLPIYRG